MVPPFVYALASSLFDVLDTITYKRAADISEKVKADPNILSFLGYFLVLLITPVFFLVFPGTISSDIAHILGSWKDVAIFSAITVGVISYNALLTVAYSNEKISVLAPYSQISEIASIVFGFVLFRSETSVQAFVAAMVATAIIFVSNFDHGKLRFNRYCLWLSASEIIRATVVVASAYVASRFHPFSIVGFQNALGFLFLAGYFLLRPKGFRVPLKGDRWPFIWTNAISNLCWVFVTAIGLFLFQEIGLVATILLSMVTLAVTIAASYFVYGDVPRKKDVVTASLVLLCIAVGFV